MEMNWLCQVWGQGEHNCKWEKSPNIFLEPTCLNLKAIQMGSNPNAKLNHHMNPYEVAPCEVTRSSDKVKLHDVLEIAYGLLQTARGTRSLHGWCSRTHTTPMPATETGRG